MDIPRYAYFMGDGMIESPDGEFVKYSDYEYLSEYCDHLVAFSKLPCLPKDLENLREANTFFAEENQQLKNEIIRLKNSIRSISDQNVSNAVPKG